jgi:glycosyltransferase involved in cell wall biosynthesis
MFRLLFRGRGISSSNTGPERLPDGMETSLAQSMQNRTKKNRIALVHYWLTGMRGGERVLESLCRIYPEADIFTNVFVPSAISPVIRQHTVRTTFVQKLPFVSRLYPYYLPFMPAALESLDLREYDLVISSESGPAKNVIVRPDALHLCYCHSPMRYLWDLAPEYASGRSWLVRAGMLPVLSYMRLADVTSAARVDAFIANSRFTARRIRKYWRRSAAVVHPPVDTSRFRIRDTHQDYFLWLGQLVPYKRPDIAVDAFAQGADRLIVAGSGPELGRCRRRAGKNVIFLGPVSEQEAEALLAECRALVFTGTEDFGIVPLEAMASGRPVIAYKRGGAEETVKGGVTGLFFNEQTADALQAALQRFKECEQLFSPAAIRAWAEQFDECHFEKRFQETVDEWERSDHPEEADIGPGTDIDSLPSS